jgi:hypothetical protein
MTAVATAGGGQIGRGTMAPEIEADDGALRRVHGSSHDDVSRTHLITAAERRPRGVKRTIAPLLVAVMESSVKTYLSFRRRP